MTEEHRHALAEVEWTVVSGGRQPSVFTCECGHQMEWFSDDPLPFSPVPMDD